MHVIFINRLANFRQHSLRQNYFKINVKSYHFVKYPPFLQEYLQSVLCSHPSGPDVFEALQPVLYL